MTRALAALAFVVAFGLTMLWLTDRNTAFCATSESNIGFVLCHAQHGAHGP